jgi:hypothetical protein
MARVVLIHGAFHELWGPHELKARWLPALRDGLWHHGVELDEDDVDVCFYGDLFRRRPGTEADAKLAASRIDVEQAMRTAGGDGLLAALDQAANDAAFERTVDMMAALAAEPDLTLRIGGRLTEAIGPDTLVVVAHSLGTVVSYVNLCNHPHVAVHLVTLGSPLGHPMLADHLSAMAPTAGGWPGSARSWVNVAAVGDQATGGIDLSERYGPRVEHHVVDNGHRAHDALPYLNAEATGAAVARALAGD